MTGAANAWGAESAMYTHRLHGREQNLLGGHAALAQGSAAIVLSIGGAKKIRGSADPNEDSVGFAEAEGGTLLVVADGHWGRDAAEVVVDRVLSRRAPEWTAKTADALSADWPSLAVEALVDAHAAIVEHVARGGSPDARTTLALALLRPDQDLLAYAAAADSSVFRVGETDAVELAPGSREVTIFLGTPGTPEDALRGSFVVGTERLAGTRAVVVVSDGFTEAGIGVESPPLTLLEIADRTQHLDPEARSLEVARSTVDRALEAHRRHGGGDNVASAAVWVTRVP